MAEQAQETNTNQADITANVNNNGESMQEKTFSQDELNDILRKRINEVNTRNDEKVKTAVAEALKEYDRKAKLTAEEKAAEESKALQDSLAQKEHDLLIRENRADAREMLQEKGISLELLDYVVDADAETTRKNISKFEKIWNKAVEDGVNKKTAGKTLSDPSVRVSQPSDKKSTLDILYGRN